MVTPPTVSAVKCDSTHEVICDASSPSHSRRRSRLPAEAASADRHRWR